MRALVYDVWYACRTLRKAPSFTLLVVLILALGIGADTAIFSLVNSVLLKPLRFGDSKQLYVIHESIPQWANSYPVLDANLPDFQIWRKQCHSFEDIAILESTSAIVAGAGETDQIRGTRASANLLSLLGVQPALGRLFLPEEDEAEHGYSVILTDALWRTRFKADRSIVGRSIFMDERPYTIVGVLPSSFQMPGAVNGLSKRAQFIVPLNGPKPYEQGLIGEFDFTAIGRLRSGVTPAQAVAELDVIQARIAKDARANVDLRADIAPLQSEVVASAHHGLVLLLAAVGAVLLIICVNLANLLLARLPGRLREAGIRKALGASELRLFRQMLSESLVVALLGGALGTLLAQFGIGWLAHFGSAEIPRLNEIRFDSMALAFVLCVSLSTAVLFGVLPAWMASRADWHEALSSVGRSVSENRHTRKLRAALVAIEVGMCTVLLIVAGLLGRSWLRLINLDPGFDVAHVLSAEVELPPVAYATNEQREAFYRSALDGARSIPGVSSVAWTSMLPLEGEGSVSGVNLPGNRLPPDQAPIVNYRAVSKDYLQTMSIPILAGRGFTDHDRGRHVVIVSQTLALRLWPNQNPVGQQCVAEWGPLQLQPSEVIGVVADVRTRLDRPPLNMIYVADSWARTPPGDPGSAAIVVRTQGDPITVAGAVRHVIHQAGPDVPIIDLRPMSQLVALSLQDRRFQASVIWSFAVSALLLASMGVFGVLAYSVEQRRREFGIRTALGAQPTDLLAMLMRQGLSPVAFGLVVGVAGAMLGGRLIQSLIFGISIFDPLTFITVSVLITGVAAVACYIPASRAMNADPVTVLRYE